MAGIRPFRNFMGGEAMRLQFPLAASEDYDAGDPLFLSSQQLTEPPQDGTEVLIAEFAGFAFDPAIAAGGEDLSGLSGAGLANEFRSLILPVHGQTFITRNFWTAASVTGRNRPLGSDIGALKLLAFNSGATGAETEWGLEDGAPTLATNVAAMIMAIYEDGHGAIVTDADLTLNSSGPGDPIDAANTTTGVWVEFMMVGTNQFMGSATVLGGGA